MYRLSTECLGDRPLRNKHPCGEEEEPPRARAGQHSSAGYAGTEGKSIVVLWCFAMRRECQVVQRHPVFLCYSRPNRASSSSSLMTRPPAYSQQSVLISPCPRGLSQRRCPHLRTRSTRTARGAPSLVHMPPQAGHRHESALHARCSLRGFAQYAIHHLLISPIFYFHVRERGRGHAWDTKGSRAPSDECCSRTPKSHEARARDGMGACKCVAIPLG